MRRTANTVLVLLVAASVGLSGVLLVGRPEPASYPDSDYLAGVDRLPTVEAVEFFTERAGSTHQDPLTLTTLGRLQLTRFRETGDTAHLDEAERTIEGALALREGHAGALLALGTVRHAQHRFTEALDLARAAHSEDPSADTLGLMGDVLSALGDYQGAEELYQQVVADYGAGPVLPGLALVAEVRGRPDEAVRLLERAAADSLERHLVGEPAAWYQLRLAGLHLEHGQLADAERRFSTARLLFPESVDVVVGLGEVAAARGDHERAIELLESVLGRTTAPDVYVTLGDLYTVTGRPDAAEVHYARAVGDMEAVPARLTGRELAMFHADHDRNPDEALRLARQDFARRQDLHGFEALAWTLYRAGEYEEAQAVSDEALAFGVIDAPLHYHAGLIALALGDASRAESELREALDVNPSWHVVHASHARELLETLAS